MKKIVLLLLVLFLCFSFSACGENESYEVAEKIDGTWTAVWESGLGQMANIYTFDYSGQDAGKCEFYNVMDGEVFVHYVSGVFEVRDGKISMNFRATEDDYGNIEALESMRTLTLSYTYEDGEVIIMDGDRQFYKTE
jgi:hypothetical protein